MSFSPKGQLIFHELPHLPTLPFHDPESPAFSAAAKCTRSMMVSDAASTPESLKRTRIFQHSDGQVLLHRQRYSIKKFFFFPSLRLFIGLHSHFILIFTPLIAKGLHFYPSRDQ